MQRIRQADWERFCHDPREETFRPVYLKSKALIWTLCVRILHSEEDARDAFQSAYCRLLALADPSDPSSSPVEDIQDTIYRLAVREANNLRMKRTRRARKEVVMEQIPTAAQDGPRADQVAINSQVRHRVENIVTALPDRYRLPVLLHYFHGMTHREIAAALGKPVSTISNRIDKALRKLQPLMRRAGLGGVASLLLAIGARAALIEPPKGLGSLEVFHAASHALAAGPSLGAASSGSLLPPSILAGLRHLMELLQLNQVKVSVVALIVLGLIGGGVTLKAFDRARPADVATIKVASGSEAGMTAAGGTAPALAVNGKTLGLRTANPGNSPAQMTARTVDKGIGGTGLSANQYGMLLQYVSGNCTQHPSK